MKCRELVAVHGETLSEKNRLVAFVGMLPEDLQKEAFRGVDEAGNELYENEG